MTPEQRSSQDYSRDRAKVVPRGASHRPDIPFKFKPIFGVGNRVADSQPFKSLENLAKEANTWSQWKRNVPPQQGCELLRELIARNSDLATSLKSGMTKGTLSFYDNVRDLSAPALSHSQRMNVSSSTRPKRFSKTCKLEKLVLQDPLRVKIFRKVLDRKSGKPLFKLAKIKVTRVTDHYYVTDKGKIDRKNHSSLRCNFNHPKFSATPATVGERLQRRIAPRPHSQPSTSPIQRQTSEPSKGKVIDLTAESSSEDSLITGPQLELVEAPGHALQSSAQADVSTQTTILQPPTTSASTSSTGILATPYVSSSQSKPHTSGEPHTLGDDPYVEVQGAAITDPAEAIDHAKSDSTRSSGRSKKPTRFFGDPLRHSVKSVTKSVNIESSQQLPAPEEQLPTTPFDPIVRKGVQLPFPRTKERTKPFKIIRIKEPENNS